jgi:hypothetical protein
MKLTQFCLSKILPDTAILVHIYIYIPAPEGELSRAADDADALQTFQPRSNDAQKRLCRLGLGCPFRPVSSGTEREAESQK